MIGSGIAGIAAAIRLANKGFNVTVFEANGYPGGKIAEFHANGYRFDMGPSVFTMPDYVDELFIISGKNPREYFTYSKLDPIFKYFFPDGTVINTFHDKEQLAEEFEEKTGVKKETTFRFLKKSEVKYDITNPVFLQRSLHQPMNYLNYETLYGILNFRKIDAFQTMDEYNQKFFNEPRIAEIFNRYASYNGSNPYEAPATLNVIAHYEINSGVYLPDGGIYVIVKALVKLAEEIGVVFKLNTPVKEIMVEGKEAKAVRTENEVLPFDIIISNADVYHTYHRLMPGVSKPERVLNQPKSSSVIVFYWGIKKTFPELGLHNMFLSRDSKEEYNFIFKKADVFSDPTIYLYASSKLNRADAPPGCENWFVMITAPNNNGQDWDAIVKKARAYAMLKLGSTLQTDVSSLIEYEDMLDPRVIEKRTSSAFGAVYGNSSNNKFSAFLRHPNFSRRIKNLYFCGGSVHPGGGIPLCLLSAKIVAGMIK